MIYIENEDDALEAATLTLSEFNRRIEAMGVIATIDDYRQLAPVMRALARNETLLQDFYAQEFLDIDQFQKKQNQSAQTLILSRLENCDVRVVFWPAVQETGDPRDRAAFSYEAAHDHNFHFITVGYMGPGYTTQMYKYDNAAIEGVVGEAVQIDTVGEFTLKRGDVMIYEKSVDIHTQTPPPSFSVSINVIPKQPFSTCQYIFDISKQRIVSTILDSSQLQYLAHIAEGIGTEEVLAAYADLKAGQSA